MPRRKWENFTLEFLSIFIAVVAAFALNNWNEGRRDRNAETKILKEIANGLRTDIEDIKLNMMGHRMGLRACGFWREAITGQAVDQDSILPYYSTLTRDFISILNVSGYESLKSRGLEIIDNDSLRAAVILVYEYDLNILRKFEEEYEEMQFQRSYFTSINDRLAPHFMYDSLGTLVGIEQPLDLDPADKRLLLTYLWKIEGNRAFIMRYYTGVEKKIENVISMIEKEVAE